MMKKSLYLSLLLLMSATSGFALLDGKDQQPFTTLPKAQWEQIKDDIEQDRYRFYQNEENNAYRAINVNQGLKSRFNSNGVAVTSHTHEWQLSLHLSHYGYGDKLHSVPKMEKTVVQGNRIEYQRYGLVEWYINEPRGLEQGFTLMQPPIGGNTNEPLVLRMTTESSLRPTLSEDAKNICFLNDEGKEVLRYANLKAWDATGTVLKSQIILSERAIQLQVDDKHAHYPIVIDPYIQKKIILTPDDYDRTDPDAFGWSVAIEGNIAVVGAKKYGEHTYDGGAAYIFYRNQDGKGEWGLIKKLTAGEDEAKYAKFGHSVSISSGRVIIGAYGANEAYIFARNQGGTDHWGLQKRLTVPDVDDNRTSQFGFSVSISGNTAIVGAKYGANYDYSKTPGCAFIFYRNLGGTDNWGPYAKLLGRYAGENGDFFGASVAIDGDLAAVGARGEDDHGENSGAVYLFSRNLAVTNGPQHWGRLKQLHAADAKANGFFGHSVAIDGDTLVVGSTSQYNDYISPDPAGSAYIFNRDQGGSDNWGQVRKVTAGDLALGSDDIWNAVTGDEFGHGVSISEDSVVVGAPHILNTDMNSTGYAFVFNRNQGGIDNWGEAERISRMEAASNSLGDSVAIDENTILIGDTAADDTAWNNGIAYIYQYAAPKFTVTPKRGFITTGPIGGPFTPQKKKYVLSNPYNDVTIDWTVTTKKFWLSLRKGSKGSWRQTINGRLEPGTQQTIWTEINHYGNCHKADTYNGTLTFINNTTGRNDTIRKVSLTVTP